MISSSEYTIISFNVSESRYLVNVFDSQSLSILDFLLIDASFFKTYSLFIHVVSKSSNSPETIMVFLSFLL